MSRLREGFTTGSAAAAAVKAALLALLGPGCPETADVPLPAGGRLAVPVACCRAEGAAMRARVVKDAGDDPDATHGAAIEALVTLNPAGPPGQVDIRGGVGVGLVTRPGLPVAVGQPAINPAPRRQIAQAAAEVLENYGGSVTITIEVPDGAAIAKRTLNARLGILGGISILGTRGTVRPFSHSAWAATIASALDVARAAGLDHAGLSTGGRSERALMGLSPGWPETAFVQAADHFGFAMRAAADRGFAFAAWGVFFGKLAKQAQGLFNTHAGQAPLDFVALADHCSAAGLPQALCRQAATANTALQVLEMIRHDPAAPALYSRLLALAGEHARRFARGRMDAAHALFDFDGRLLATYGRWP